MLERPNQPDRNPPQSRQGAYRARVRARRIVCRVEVGERILTLLTRNQWLTGDTTSREAIGDAIRRLLEDSAEA